MGKGRVEEVFQEEGSVDVRAQSKEQAQDVLEKSKLVRVAGSSREAWRRKEIKEEPGDQ